MRQRPGQRPSVPGCARIRQLRTGLQVSTLPRGVSARACLHAYVRCGCACGWVLTVAGLGKGQGAKEIGHNLARERPKFGHNLGRKRHKIGHSLECE